MKNRFLSPATAADIDGQIEKVLRGLGNPEPPLRLEEVRELLKLDRQFYTTTDAGIMAETLSRLRIASQQVILRPTLIFDAIKKWDFRAFYLPDRKRILIDEAVPKPKHRWIEGHEITHGILPWHAELMLGDTDQTLSPACHEHLESEANYGAGQLLFLRKQFANQAADLPFTIASVTALAKIFNNTITSTMWRMVETAHNGRCVFGVVSCHPHPRFRPNTFNPENPCRYFIRSPLFAAQFSGVTEKDIFEALESYCAPRSGGPLGEIEMPIVDDNGQAQIFQFETFFNRHEALTLGSYVRTRANVAAVTAL